MTPRDSRPPAPLRGTPPREQHLWPGKARSTVSLDWGTACDLRFVLPLVSA